MGCDYLISSLGSYRLGCDYLTSSLVSYRLGCDYLISSLGSYSLGCDYLTPSLGSYRLGCDYLISSLESYRLGCDYLISSLSRSALVLNCLNDNLPKKEMSCFEKVKFVYYHNVNIPWLSFSERTSGLDMSSIAKCTLSVCFISFSTSSSTTRVYRGRVPRLTSDICTCYHTRQSGETKTSVSAGHIILTPTLLVGSGRPQLGRTQELRALLTHLPPLPSPALQNVRFP